jgi:hypothetical protein
MRFAKDSVGIREHRATPLERKMNMRKMLLLFLTCLALMMPLIAKAQERGNISANNHFSVRAIQFDGVGLMDDGLYGYYLRASSGLVFHLTGASN